MALRFGLAEESFKLCTGHDIFQNDGAVYGRVHWRDAAACGLSMAFQAVVKSDVPALLVIGEQPAFHRRGITPVYRLEVSGPLPVTLRHIGMVTGDDCLQYGDILLSSPTVELEAAVPASVYVQVEVPPGTAPGPYTGQLRIWASVGFGEETEVETAVFETEVFAYTLPAPARRRFYLDLWQHPANIARHAEVPLWSDRHFALLEPYLRLLAELGQRAVTAIVSEIPWCGQAGFMEHRCTTDLYEYAMVRVFRQEDGALRFDFSVLERYIRLCFSCGFCPNSEIEVFGLVNIWHFEDQGFGGPSPAYPEPIRIRVREWDGHYAYLTEPEEIDGYIQALEHFFRERGWLAQVRVAADEPADTERFRRSMEHMKRIAPGFRYKTAINRAGFIREFQTDMDDFVPIYDCLTAEYETLRELRAAMPDKRFLWYVCCLPAFPNFFIGSHLLEGRAVGALTYAAGLGGFLRWDFTVWNEDPRRDLRYPRFPCGDMNFVYPAGDMTPLLSLRLQMLRRGAEDYELMAALKDAGQEEAVAEWLALTVRGGGLSAKADSADQLLSLDFRDYAQGRRRALELLSTRGEG